MYSAMKKFTPKHSTKKSLTSKNKDKQLISDFLIKEVTTKSGLTFDQIISLQQEKRIYLILKYVTYTARPIYETFNIHAGSFCRRKRKLEENGQLVQTPKKLTCPYTKDKAHFLTTNKLNFSRVLNNLK
jgi:hypothetical protein